MKDAKKDGLTGAAGMRLDAFGAAGWVVHRDSPYAEEFASNL